MIAAGATRDLKWIANLAVGLKTICHGSLIGVGSRDGETMRNLMSIFRYHPLVIRVEYVDGKPAWDKITKIEIVKDHGEVVQSYTPDTPDYNVSWSPTITGSTSKYFFVRVWSAGGGDAPGGSPDKPIAWLAPVWTGR